MRVVSMCELRQQAAELVLGAMAGEEATITVAGRPSARLVPFARRTWRTYDEIAHLFHGRADPEWGADRDPFDR